MEEESGYTQKRVQLTCTGAHDGPHGCFFSAKTGRPVTFFLKEFDFGALDNDRRWRIFNRRTTPGETRSYGFAARRPGGRHMVHEYGGKPKSSHILRGGTKTSLDRTFVDILGKQ